MSIQQILSDLAGHLEALREDGVKRVSVSRETLEAFGRHVNTPPPDPRLRLEKIAARIARCTLCPLHSTRTNTVPGQGNPAPEIMFIGEAPGEDEDLQGLAFVGRAGQLLTRMIERMGLTRDEVFIANILKCRPPDNRKPLPGEMSRCLPYLREQVAILNPRVIVALGGTAVHGLLGLETGITRMRGKWMSFNGIDLMPTFHPSYLLRVPSARHDTWSDMLAVLTKLGKPLPKPGTRSGEASGA